MCLIGTYGDVLELGIHYISRLHVTENFCCAVVLLLVLERYIQ